MRKLSAVMAGMLIPAFLATGVVFNSALAQEKAAPKAAQAAGQVTVKELAKNDKVRVYEATFKPGDVAPSMERQFRVVRYMTAGEIQRTYPDGKKDTLKFKAGDVRLADKGTYEAKNISKKTVVLYIVQPL